MTGIEKHASSSLVTGALEEMVCFSISTEMSIHCNLNTGYTFTAESLYSRSMFQSLKQYFEIQRFWSAVALARKFIRAENKQTKKQQTNKKPPTLSSLLPRPALLRTSLEGCAGVVEETARGAQFAAVEHCVGLMP